MNTSNRFDMETIARQRQADIERYIQQTTLLRSQHSPVVSRSLKVRWVVGATTLSILSLLALIVIGHLH